MLLLGKQIIGGWVGGERGKEERTRTLLMNERKQIPVFDPECLM